LRISLTDILEISKSNSKPLIDGRLIHLEAGSFVMMNLPLLYLGACNILIQVFEAVGPFRA
jgi:hypothetical protein